MLGISPAVFAKHGVAARAARGLLFGALAIAVAGCNQTTTTADPTGSIGHDYKLRHPIAIKERPRSIELLVGSGRGGLTPVHRAEVLSFAGGWRRDATAGVIIERPVGASNERAALDTSRDVIAILVATGIPQHGIAVKPYQPAPGKLGPLRLSFPQMMASVGPCGMWPEDIGPTLDPMHYENVHYWNYGCATQRNLAAMVDDPHDLVQPRAETPTYTAKRTFGMEKWRKGEAPGTTYPDGQKGAISDLGK